MADEAARRREIRRRRILENAEERKKKIFGTTASSTLPSPEEKEECDNVSNRESTQPLSSASTVSLEEGNNENVFHLKTTPSQVPEVEERHPSAIYNESEHDVDIIETKRAPSFRAENGVDSIPDMAEQLKNFNTFLTEGVGSTGMNATQSMTINNDVQSAHSTYGARSSSAVPVILALFVCILLSVNLGYVVSYSIALPFLLWEVHHLWCQRYDIAAMSRGMGGLLGLALVLSGVQQSFIHKMAQVFTVIRYVFEDFAFYILTVVTWYCLIGLPGTVHTKSDFPPEPETVRMNAPEDDDIYARDYEF
ncbi:hypothetical protein SK128_010223 [Halocaridina rubra]|uniref:Uncharacterized protein n=1 Tax=Halocaridina rubra TaxID=373956 RepID=A0AAN9ACU5_HALRR